jgi:hypothetical protein
VGCFCFDNRFLLPGKSHRNAIVTDVEYRCKMPQPRLVVSFSQSTFKLKFK